MSVYVDEGFRPCVTECATVAFRVCFDDRAAVFEVSAEALMTYCGAASKRRSDLLVAFEDAPAPSGLRQVNGHHGTAVTPADDGDIV